MPSQYTGIFGKTKYITGIEKDLQRNCGGIAYTNGKLGNSKLQTKVISVERCVL